MNAILPLSARTHAIVDCAILTSRAGDATGLAGFPGLVEALESHPARCCVVDRDAQDRGAALWVAPDGDADDLRPATAHWHLAWIGVRAEARGRGIGTRLLAHGLARADAQGLPAYLVAAGRAIARRCARQGFHPIASVAAPGLPELVSMWRIGRAEPFSG